MVERHRQPSPGPGSGSSSCSAGKSLLCAAMLPGVGARSLIKDNEPLPPITPLWRRACCQTRPTGLSARQVFTSQPTRTAEKRSWRDCWTRRLCSTFYDDYWDGIGPVQPAAVIMSLIVRFSTVRIPKWLSLVPQPHRAAITGGGEQATVRAKACRLPRKAWRGCSRPHRYSSGHQASSPKLVYSGSACPCRLLKVIRRTRPGHSLASIARSPAPPSVRKIKGRIPNGRWLYRVRQPVSGRLRRCRGVLGTYRTGQSMTPDRTGRRTLPAPEPARPRKRPSSV
jgi:hypothetical protein